MDTEHQHYHEEAQVIAFTTVNFSGFELNITARQGATAEVILDTTRELVKALARLQEAGASPVVKSWSHNGNGNGSQKPAQKPATDPSGWDELPAHDRSAHAPAQPQPAPAPAPAAPVLDNGALDPAWCPVHQVPMRRNEKNGAVWYSHKVGDAWCKGKPAKS